MSDYGDALLRELVLQVRGLREDANPSVERPSDTANIIDVYPIGIASARTVFERIDIGRCFGIKVVSGGATDTFLVFGGDAPDAGATSTLALRTAIRAANNLVYTFDKPIYWIWIRNYTGATGPLIIQVDRAHVERTTQDDAGAGSTVAFSTSQPVYLAEEGGTTASSQPTYHAVDGSTTESSHAVHETSGADLNALRASTLPATLASNTTISVKHVFLVAPKLVIASTVTNLSASATYTSTTVPCAHDAGGGNMQTEGRLAGGFGVIAVAVFSSHAGNVYYDGQIAGSTTWRQIVTFVKAGGTMDHDTRHVNGMTRARVRHVNDGTTTTTFELFASAIPRLTGYNNA